MLELVAGLVVTAAAVALVVEPLVSRRGAPAADHGRDDELSPIEESGSPKVQALLALKEIEFDRATGKLSETDYKALKAKYSRAALDAMQAEEAAPAAVSAPAAAPEDLLDAAEAAVQRIKQRGQPVCPVCGPRPEPAAAFCSSCGRRLGLADASARCWRCGVELPDDAKFCAGCGGAVAA